MTSPGQAAGAAQQAAGQTASTAKDEAAATAQTAATAATDVAGTAKQQAGQVAGEAVDQVRQLTEQARGQVSEQAGIATQRLSETVRSLAGEVRDLSQGRGDSAGTVAGYAQQLADKGEQLAEYVSRQGPGGLVQELRGFAARRPGTFLLGALAAGVATGRLVKGVTAGSGSAESSTSSPGGADAVVTGPPTTVVQPVEPLPVTEAELAYDSPVAGEPYPHVGTSTTTGAGGASGVDTGYSPPSTGSGTGLR